MVEDTVFVACRDAWTPPSTLDGVQLYMEVPLGVVRHGTFGHQDEGYHLLDSYWPTPSITAKSLDWTSRSGSGGSSGNSVVVGQLYKFDALSSVNPISSDDLLIRRASPEGTQAILNYVPISSVLGGVQVDTGATEGTQCSIDKKEDQQTSSTYLQLYNFDQTGHENNTLTVNLAYGQSRYAHFFGDGTYPDTYSHFIVRNSYQNNLVEYDALEVYAPPIYAGDIQDLSQTISGWGFICSCDCQGLSTMIAELSNELSDRWKCGGTYDDNCYGQSIGDDSQNPQIDLNNGQLLYSNELDPTVDWHNGYLSWNNAELRLDWGECGAYDKNQTVAIDWDYRHLYDDAGNLALRWSDRILHDSNQLGALDWNYRTLYDSNLHIVADWERQQLLDANTTPAVDWGSRHLDDSN